MWVHKTSSLSKVSFNLLGSSYSALLTVCHIALIHIWSHLGYYFKGYDSQRVHFTNLPSLTQTKYYFLPQLGMFFKWWERVRSRAGLHPNAMPKLQRLSQICRSSSLKDNIILKSSCRVSGGTWNYIPEINWTQPGINIQIKHYTVTTQSSLCLYSQMCPGLTYYNHIYITCRRHISWPHGYHLKLKLIFSFVWKPRPPRQTPIPPSPLTLFYGAAAMYICPIAA